VTIDTAVFDLHSAICILQSTCYLQVFQVATGNLSLPMNLCIFCGSAVGSRAAYTEAAQRLGKLLVERGIGLVYGGGNVGLMGVIADSVLSGGGSVIGVMPRNLIAREIGHAGITELRVVDTMHQRKALMADLSSGFIALPGGYGTFDEFFEVVTWTQLGLHRKGCGLLNVDGYYDPMVAMLDRAVADGFILPHNRALVLDDTSPEPLLDRVLSFQPPATEKWLDRKSR
jgi:uncharacterized protein (TIGR00730 family)